MNNWQNDFNKMLTLSTALAQFIDNAEHKEDQTIKTKFQLSAANEMLADVDKAIASYLRRGN